MNKPALGSDHGHILEHHQHHERDRRGDVRERDHARHQHHHSRSGCEHGQGSVHVHGHSHDHGQDHVHAHKHDHSHQHGDVHDHHHVHHDHHHDHHGCDHDHGLGGILHHHHDFSHVAADPSNRKYLAYALYINIAFLIAEIVGGIVFSSIALLSDAAHMLTDVGALALALVAANLATRAATQNRTYGFGRVEPLAAFVNACTLIGASVWIIYEATMRLIHPVEVVGGGVMVIAFGGLVANGVASWWLTRADRHNVNVRAALAHSLMDAVSSVGVLVAGAIVMFTGVNSVDSFASYLVAGLSILGTWGLLKQCLHQLLDGAPDEVDTVAVASRLLQQPDVVEVHDLHVWTIANNRHAMTAHVLVDPSCAIDNVVEALHSILRREFRIDHATLQVVPDRSRQLIQIGRSVVRPASHAH